MWDSFLFLPHKQHDCRDARLSDELKRCRGVHSDGQLASFSQGELKKTEASEERVRGGRVPGSADPWIFLRAAMKTQCDRASSHRIAQETP